MKRSTTVTDGSDPTPLTPEEIEDIQNLAATPSAFVTLRDWITSLKRLALRAESPEVGRLDELQGVLRFLDNEGRGWKADALWAFDRVRAYIEGRRAATPSPSPVTDGLREAARRLLDAMEANRDGDIIRAAKALDAALHASRDEEK